MARDELLEAVVTLQAFVLIAFLFTYLLFEMLDRGGALRKDNGLELK